ncbi:MAG: hypothetical protein GY950_01325, partial [bacterium]|nr:hypothetical protein [bacterium]
MFTTNRNKANILIGSTILLCLYLVSCNPKFTEPESGTSFQKIYHKDDLFTYSAIDVQQTRDGGYIILGTVGEAPYLLRVDNEGNYMWDTAPGAFNGCRLPSASLLIINSPDQGDQ